ncbi:MAG: hypothetical protein VB009_00035 [Erysipelotrichaceae bacterium]|nr:hypothetical protein [Erysipelotrichaceae bacterium]
MNALNELADRIESYKKSDKKSQTYIYNGITYQKNFVQGVAVFAFLNLFLAILIIIVYSETVGSIFSNNRWLIAIALIAVMLIFIPLVVFVIADKKQ